MPTPGDRAPHRSSVGERQTPEGDRASIFARYKNAAMAGSFRAGPESCTASTARCDVARRVDTWKRRPRPYRNHPRGRRRPPPPPCHASMYTRREDHRRPARPDTLPSRSRARNAGLGSDEHAGRGHLCIMQPVSGDGCRVAGARDRPLRRSRARHAVQPHQRSAARMRASTVQCRQRPPVNGIAAASCAKNRPFLRRSNPAARMSPPV